MTRGLLRGALLLAMSMLLCACQEAAPGTSQPELPGDLRPLRLEDGRYQVKGWIIATSEGVEICGAILQSLPPMCGSTGLALDNLNPATLPGAQSRGGVTWVEAPLRVIGELQGNRLSVDEVAPWSEGGN